MCNVLGGVLGVAHSEVVLGVAYLEVARERDSYRPFLEVSSNHLETHLEILFESRWWLGCKTRSSPVHKSVHFNKLLNNLLFGRWFGKPSKMYRTTSGVEYHVGNAGKGKFRR